MNRNLFRLVEGYIYQNIGDPRKIHIYQSLKKSWYIHQQMFFLIRIGRYKKNPGNLNRKYIPMEVPRKQSCKNFRKRCSLINSPRNPDQPGRGRIAQIIRSGKVVITGFLCNCNTGGMSGDVLEQ